MGRKKTRRKPLGTIWEVPDELWRRIEPLLKEFWPRKATGRPPAHSRRTLNGIIFRMRSGCQWDQLPERYGPKSTVHGWFQRWAAGGVLEKIWAVLVAECEELGGVEWKWQAADGMLGKAGSAPGRCVLFGPPGSFFLGRDPGILTGGPFSKTISTLP